MNDHLRPQGIIAFDLGWRESDLNLTFFDDVEGAAAYIEHYDFETTRVFDLNGYEYSLSLEPARGWFFRYEKTALTKTERQPLDELRALLNRCLRSELPSEVDDLRDPEVYAVLRTHRAHSPQKRRPESDVAIVLGRRNGFHDWWIDLDSCRVSGADVTFNIAYPVGG